MAAGGGRTVINIRRWTRGRRAGAHGDYRLGRSLRCHGVRCKTTARRAAQHPGKTGDASVLLRDNHILSRIDEVFSAAAFSEFCLFYVSGFYDLCEALRKRQTNRLEVLYPSSEFVLDRPAGLTEYAMAKCAGEILCKDTNRRRKDIRVTVAWLPRVLTDQTAAISTLEVEDPVKVMLPLVRQIIRQPETRLGEGVPIQASGHSPT